MESVLGNGFENGFVREFRQTLEVMVALKQSGTQLTRGQAPTVVVRSNTTGDHVMLAPRHMQALARMIGD